MVRRAVAVATFALVGAAMACGSIDLAYSPSALSDGGAVDGESTDGGGSSSGNVLRIIRDSSFEANVVFPAPPNVSDAGECNPDEEDGGGCDFTQGLGCCFGPTGPHCIFQTEMTKYQCTVFVGCRTDDSEIGECCWNKLGDTAYTALSASCADGGRPHACLEIDGSSTCANGGTCNTKSCDVDGGTWQLGICGTGELSCQ